MRFSDKLHSVVPLMVICIVAMINSSYAFVSSTGFAPKQNAIYSTSTKKEIETFRKADFVSSVAEKTGMNKKESEEALKAVLEVITEQVNAGKRVNLPSFGTFTMKQRAARKGRNPQTGEPLEIAASKSPGFSPAKAWKDSINGRA